MKHTVVQLCAFVIFATLNFCCAQASALDSMNFHPLRITTADSSTIVTLHCPLAYVVVSDTVSYGLDDTRFELAPGRWFLFN